MSEVGTETSVSRGAANSMAIDAGGGFENLPAVADGGVDGGRLLLRGDPSIEVGARLDDHAQQHHGVLGAAVLAALPEVGPGDVRIDPHRIFPVRDDVSLAGQARHPEAVRDIGGLEIKKRRRRDFSDRSAEREAHWR